MKWEGVILIFKSGKLRRVGAKNVVNMVGGGGGAPPVTLCSLFTVVVG